MKFICNKCPFSPSCILDAGTTEFKPHKCPFDNGHAKPEWFIYNDKPAKMFDVSLIKGI